MPDCNKCIWSTRDGQCVSWTCDFISHEDARKALERKQPEVVFCKDCRKHNVRVGYEVSFKTNWRDDACPLADWRGKAQGHEFDYQYCVYAERGTE